MSDDIKKIIKDTAKTTAKEVRREFDIVIEDLEKGTLKAIKEELDTQGERLDGIEKHVIKMDRDLTQVKDDVAVIKTTLEGTDTEKPLKQRVKDLEAKTRA